MVIFQLQEWLQTTLCSACLNKVNPDQGGLRENKNFTEIYISTKVRDKNKKRKILWAIWSFLSKKTPEFWTRLYVSDFIQELINENDEKCHR